MAFIPADVVGGGLDRIVSIPCGFAAPCGPSCVWVGFWSWYETPLPPLFFISAIECKAAKGGPRKLNGKLWGSNIPKHCSTFDTFLVAFFFFFYLLFFTVFCTLHVYEYFSKFCCTIIFGRLNSVFEHRNLGRLNGPLIQIGKLKITLGYHFLLTMRMKSWAFLLFCSFARFYVFNSYIFTIHIAEISRWH